MKGSTKRGFTLMEVIIAATILTVVLGVVISLLITTGNFFDTASIDADLHLRAQTAMETVTSQLTGVYRNTITFNTSNVNYATLSYKVPMKWNTTDNKPDYLLSGVTQWRTIVWHNDADPKMRKLTLTYTGGSPSTIANDVSGFNIIFMTNTNDTKYLIFVTLSKQFTAPTPEWRTQTLKKEIYILKEPE